MNTGIKVRKVSAVYSGYVMELNRLISRYIIKQGARVVVLVSAFIPETLLGTMQLKAPIQMNPLMH